MRKKKFVKLNFFEQKKAFRTLPFPAMISLLGCFDLLNSVNVLGGQMIANIALGQHAFELHLLVGFPNFF